MIILQIEIDAFDTARGNTGAVAKYYESTVYRCDIPNIHPVYGKNLLFYNSPLGLSISVKMSLFFHQITKFI